MDKKYKAWLKSLGIAGFLFFLIKGILWLIFGTALLKWLKTVLVCAILYSPFTLFSQIQHIKYRQLDNPDSLYTYKPNLIQFIKTTKPFFCNLETRINNNKKYNFKFRLGSVDYINTLEYSSFLQNKYKPQLY